MSFYLVLLFVGGIVTYEFKCPAALHRKIRVKTVCAEKSSDRYSCLLDKHTNTYKESCIEPADFVRPGQKYVIRVYRKNTNCNSLRYQPFKFWSYELSKCVFAKSKCYEVGQIIHNISSSSIDNACRCDHSRGYAFLHIPKYSCYCIPTQEDCTCYKKSCPSHYRLAADYQCTSSLSGRSTCPDVKIGKPVVNLTKTEKAPMNVQDIECINKTTEISRIQSTIVIFVAAIMMFSVMAIIQNKNKINDQLICSENNDLESTKTTVEVLDENKIEDSLNYKENDDFESTKTTVEVQNKNKIKDQLICSENNDLENTRTIVEDTRTTDKNMEKRTKYENDKKMHETIASEHLPNPSQQERKKKPDAGLDRIQFYGRYTLYDTISDIDLT